MKVLLPKTKEDFEKYYELRWRMLRKPWAQPMGSERDDLDTSSYHVMICKKDRIPIGVGRLHFNNAHEAQIRYMAVDEQHQKKGIGSLLIRTLEEYARHQKADHIILHAREPAIQFYLQHGYKIEEKSYLLFESIQHYQMKKML